MDTERVRARAGDFTPTRALLADPIPVRDGTGRQTSWFVPMVIGDRLAGFVELLPDLEHRRTSWFPGAPRSVEECPLASWWLDPATVMERARGEMRAGEVAGEPYLSFDTTPDRLAWAVPVGGPGGPRTVYVAGEAAWSGPAATGLG